jgi:hypothetical protein
MPLNRREFSAAAGATAVLLSAGSGFAKAAPGGAAGKPWHQRVKRVAQVNLSERDLIDMDVEAWAEMLDEARIQAVLVNVAGSLSFYPSKIPYFYPSQYLNGRDLPAECFAAARKRGIRFILRFSPDIAQTRAATDHPEWFRRKADGSIFQDNMPPGYGQTCQFSPYYDTQIPLIMAELVGRLPDVDGLYTNGWPDDRVRKCWCPACRKIGDPDSQAYLQAYQKRSVELWNLFAAIAKKGRKDRIFTGNLGGGLRGSEIDQLELTRHAEWYLADYQGRPAGAPVWDAAQQVRVANAVMDGRLVQLCTATYLRSGGEVWRNGAGNPAEIDSRIAQCFAAGGTFYWHWLSWHDSFVEDRRLKENGKALLQWQAKHDAHFHNTASLSQVAVVAATHSNLLYKAPAATDVLDPVQGLYEALLEARIPFDVVLEHDLTAARLKRYKAVLLPNVALLGDRQAGELTAYVKAGGSLLTSFETGLYDETGKPRGDFALAPLFQMHKAGAREDSHQPLPGMIAPFPATATHLQYLERPHPVTASFKDTTRILGPNWSIPVTAEGQPVMTLIDPYPPYPTEQAYSRKPRTDKPAIVLREIGQARLAHFTGDVEGTFWRSDAADLGDLVVNTVKWLLHDDPGLTVDGNGLVEVFGWQTEPGYAVHFVNYTNPGAKHGLFRRTYAVGEQRVRLTLPSAKPVVRASLLRAETPLGFTQNGRIVEFTVPGIADYEVAALEV